MTEEDKGTAGVDKDQQPKTPLPNADTRVTEAQRGKSRRDHRAKKNMPSPLKNKAEGGRHAPIWLATLALLLAGAALAGSYGLWQQGVAANTVRQQQAQQLKAMQANISAAQQELKAAAQMQQAQWQLFQRQQVSELNAIGQKLSQSRDPNGLLAEAGYLVRIANHRLQLMADVGTAIQALNLADRRLQGLRDPRLLAVRRQLRTDIGQLKAVTPIDITGMALTLSTLQRQLQRLPLLGRMTLSEAEQPETVAIEASSPATALTGGSPFFRDVWSSLQTLVTVRRVDDQSVAIIPVAQRGFLYQNLALKLEGARLALLRHDDALYHQSLAVVREWLQRYFDHQDSAVQTLLATLQQLDAIQLERELPTASASLEKIQAAIQGVDLNQQPSAVSAPVTKKAAVDKKMAAKGEATLNEDKPSADTADTEPGVTAAGERP